MKPWARSSRAGRLTAALAVLLVCVSACSGPSSAQSTTQRAATPAQSPGPGVATASSGHKLLVVVLENHGRSEALQQMPHLRGWANRFGQATNYHAITHPSLPNYLAIFGGSTFGIHSDCGVGEHGCVPAAPSVFAQTLAAGRTARAYQESMSQNCQTGSANQYAARHGPWAYWLAPNERRLCGANDVPAGSTHSGRLITDVRRGRLPVTGELTPNVCHDAHDCSLSTADRWLAGWIPKLMSGPDYRHRRLTIVITFDENDGSGPNNVAFVVIDPRLSHVVVRRPANHYALTRWLDENAGVPLLRNAASAPDLRRAFGL